MRVQRVANVSPTAPERALLCRPGAGDVVAERRCERGVVAAEQAGRVWAALTRCRRRARAPAGLRACTGTACHCRGQRGQRVQHVAQATGRATMTASHLSPLDCFFCPLSTVFLPPAARSAPCRRAESASDPVSSQLWLPSWRARSCGFRDPGAHEQALAIALPTRRDPPASSVSSPRQPAPAPRQPCPRRAGKCRQLLEWMSMSVSAGG